MPPGHPRITRHHLCPKSRGGWPDDNAADIDEILHYAWHAMTDQPEAAIPEEVAQDFLDIWWPDEGYTLILVVGQMAKTLRRRCERVPSHSQALAGREIVFPNCRPLEMVKIWLWRWVPEDYFSEVVFQAPGLTYVLDSYTVDHQLLQRHRQQQSVLLNEAYHRWHSVGHWWRNGAHFITPSIR